MLPYDGITRTGSKGVSHFARYLTCRRRPLAKAQGNGKGGEMQAKHGIIEPSGLACYTALLNSQ